MKRFLFFALLVAVFTGCTRQPKQVSLISEQMLAIDATRDAVADTAYLQHLQPINDELNAQLDVVIGYAPEALTVHKPECNMLNWASDALYDMACKVYDGQVDVAIVNMGGMRCEWQAGDLTRRAIYELMPFDNELVILTLTGQDILDLCDIFAFQGGQGVSRQLRMQMKNQKARNVLLDGKKIVPQAVYYVATSDYLSTGADHFTPLARYQQMIRTDRKIRDLYMDYVVEKKTIASTVDGRMTQL